MPEKRAWPGPGGSFRLLFRLQAKDGGDAAGASWSHVLHPRAAGHGRGGESGREAVIVTGGKWVGVPRALSSLSPPILSLLFFFLTASSLWKE